MLILSSDFGISNLVCRIYKYPLVLRQTKHPQASLHARYTVLTAGHIDSLNYELVDENPCILGIHQYPLLNIKLNNVIKIDRYAEGRF